MFDFWHQVVLSCRPGEYKPHLFRHLLPVTPTAVDLQSIQRQPCLLHLLFSTGTSLSSELNLDLNTHPDMMPPRFLIKLTMPSH